MNRQLSNVNLRLLIAAASAFTLAALFIRALAYAYTHGSFDYPWHDRVSDIFMLAFSAVAVISVVPVLVRGSLRQRIFAVTIVALPIYVLVRYTAWVAGLLSG